MSRIKDTLDYHWLQESSRVELHWMEQEYFNYIADQNKNSFNYENNFEEQENNSRNKSKRHDMEPSHEGDRVKQRLSYTRRGRNRDCG